MIVVYIASPYSKGDKEKNVKRQIEMATELVESGYCPIWPLSSHYLHTWMRQSYDTWMKVDYELLSRCDVLLRLEGESHGADLECAFAREKGIPIVHSIGEIGYIFGT